MSTQLSPAQTGTKAISQFLQQKNMLAKFTELLGSKAQGFITSVITIVNSNALLAKATQESIYTAALTAAALDLPLNPNLGFAYIVPYNNKKTGNQEGQFQVGYKGVKQLALRTGIFQVLNESDVREGEIVFQDRLTGEIEFNWIQNPAERLKTKIVGYVAYFKLENGFSKTKYMTVEELDAHGVRFSQTYKKGYGLWKDDFDGMCRKTVVKLLLSKDAPLSIEMQRAFISDQAVVRNFDTLEMDYVDNQPETPETYDHEKENARIAQFIRDAKDINTLESVKDHLEGDSQLEMIFETRKTELSK